MIFSKLVVTKPLISNHFMHNLYARFVKILEICKKIGKDLVNKDGNIHRRGVVPKFSDLEVLSLSMASESLGINCLPELSGKSVFL